MKLFDRLRRPKWVTSYRGLDAMTIEQLRDAGSDLSKPHAVEHFLYFPKRTQAEAAANRMDAIGIAPEVREPLEGHSDWLAFGTHRLVITEDSFAEVRAQLMAIAAECGGEYDGWGAPVEE